MPGKLVRGCIFALQLFAPRGLRDFRSLRFRAVIAPKVVVIERLEVFPNGNHRGTRRVQRNGANLVASRPGFFHSLSRGRGQSFHVIHMRLRGKFGILPLAVKGIFSDCGSQQPAVAIHQRNTHAQSPEVNASNYRHSDSPLKDLAATHREKENPTSRPAGNTWRNKSRPVQSAARPTTLAHVNSTIPRPRVGATSAPVRSQESGRHKSAKATRRKTRPE